MAKPMVALQSAFLRMVDDYDAHDPATGAGYRQARADFPAYVQQLHDDEQGLIGIVPYSHRWLVIPDEIVVAVVRVRHHINAPLLSNEFGHIGYDVAPSYRRRGYGVAALQAGLAHARELGLGRVLLYADSDNPASWRTIERCGGRLEVEQYSSYYQSLVRRYWITLVD
ncbi:MAG: GNAT family N-acetyltransferase [Caldilineaceae bacterium]